MKQNFIWVSPFHKSFYVIRILLTAPPHFCYMWQTSNPWVELPFIQCCSHPMAFVLSLCTRITSNNSGSWSSWDGTAYWVLAKSIITIISCEMSFCITQHNNITWCVLSVCLNSIYRQVSNIRCTLIENCIVDHSDVVGASPVVAAPTTSSFTA